MRKLGIAAGVLGGVFGGLTGYGISAAWSTLCNVPVMKPAIFVAAAGAFGPYLIIMGIALSLTPAELIESAEAVEFRELLRIKTATAFRLRFVYLLLGILACCYVVLWAAVPLEPSGCAGRY
jgi:hypothetical protein